jgi:hypothetical protein
MANSLLVEMTYQILPKVLQQPSFGLLPSYEVIIVVILFG